MKLKLFALIGILINLWFQPVYAEKIKVGFEQFPPLITNDKMGYTIAMLRSIENISDLEFTIILMTYGRAKISLEDGQIDLMGHTPYKQENRVFYTYAQELNWSIDTKSDLYATAKTMLNPENIRKKRLGVPYGNKEFHSEITGIPLEKFQEGHLENLLKMLKSGRLDAFTFERSSTMSTIIKLKIPNIHYKQLPPVIIPAGLAVRNDQKGNQLKKKLDTLILQLDQQQIFK
ncbi:MAG: hypothetical protein GY729_02300, partial [Desulfobacteraceae bacterium]|nr:hypothetical protein [Desulfobacteraceae bacterium]